MRLRRTRLAPSLLIGCLTAILPAQTAAPRAWESTLDLPTWEEGPPDAVPHLRILGAPKPWYPYTVRTAFGKQKRTERWRTLNLENEYLACVVLPDLGGRLYRCRDKVSGHEMFHANRSIKKADIALRGAWAAGGVELNFPASHSLTTVSPVDFRVAQAGDAASVWVGATDRVSGMRWRVEFRLAQGSAVLEQRVRVENATGATQKYSWWSNAGVTLADDTRFLLPARQVATHGKTRVDNWPVGSDGVDRSRPRNYSTSLGLFASGASGDWFAVYRETAKIATVHVADAAVPGKKIWVWGRQEDAEIRQLLSDDNSQYVEIQAGLFENQETFGDLAAGSARSFTEYWLPVHSMSGIVQASRDAVLWLAHEGGGIKVELLGTHKVRSAVLRIGAVTEKLDLDPATVWSKNFAATGPVELRDAAGALLLAYTEGEAGGTSGQPAVETVTQRDLVRQAAIARIAGQAARAGELILRAGKLDPTDPVTRFELTRQGSSDESLWTHLAADPERVLEIADAYLGWGLPRDAEIVLGHRYLPVPSNWTEPGMPAPQDYALVPYYRGYVHEKLHQYATEDYRLAASLPVRYVFPSRASALPVLKAALAANPGDASAHYLLGLWQLHSGNREEGASELSAANRLCPELAEARALLGQMKIEAVAPPVTKAAPPPKVRNETPSPAPPSPPRTSDAGARSEYWAAIAETDRGDAKAAARRWERIAKLRPRIDSPDYVYPILAQAALGRSFDAVSPYLNLRRELENASGARRTVLLYNEWLLLALQGRRGEVPAGLPADLARDLTTLRLPR